MPSQSTGADFIVYSFIVAGILLMTKSGSQGPTLVNNLTSGYAKILQADTGQAVSA